VSEGEQTEAEILVGTHTRAEILGLPDDVEFLQPKRTISKLSQPPSPPVEEHG
jgi:hypothetical protein